MEIIKKNGTREIIHSIDSRNSERRNVSLSCFFFFSGLFGPIFFSLPSLPQASIMAVRHLSEVEGQPSSMHFTCLRGDIKLVGHRYTSRNEATTRKFFDSNDLGGIDLFPWYLLNNRLIVRFSSRELNYPPRMRVLMLIITYYVYLSGIGNEEEQERCFTIYKELFQFTPLLSNLLLVNSSKDKFYILIANKLE